MVVKYVGLTGVTYGIHVYLAIAQLVLCAFLIANGVLLLSRKQTLSKWPSRLGLRVSKELRGRSLSGWLMILTGLVLILPLFGFPYWLAIIACPFSIYWIMAQVSDGAVPVETKAGGLARKVLAVSAVAICGFTIWEGRDLVRAGVVVTYKAAYWDYKEVQGWQKENNPHAPKVGDLAPDFVLTDVQGEDTVRLSDFRGSRPVVLLFGSFT